MLVNLALFCVSARVNEIKKLSRQGVFPVLNNGAVVRCCLTRLVSWLSEWLQTCWRGKRRMMCRPSRHIRTVKRHTRRCTQEVSDHDCLLVDGNYPSMTITSHYIRKKFDATVSNKIVEWLFNECRTLLLTRLIRHFSCIFDFDLNSLKCSLKVVGANVYINGCTTVIYIIDAAISLDGFQ